MTTGQFWLAAAAILNLWINLGIMIYFQRYRLEEIERYLAGGACVKWKKAVWEGGYIGRQMRLNTLVNIVVWPGFYYRLGEIEQDADKRIPIRLRIQLVLAYAHLYLTGIGMGALYFTLPDKSGG